MLPGFRWVPQKPGNVKVLQWLTGRTMFANVPSLSYASRNF